MSNEFARFTLSGSNSRFSALPCQYRGVALAARGGRPRWSDFHLFGLRLSRESLTDQCCILTNW